MARKQRTTPALPRVLLGLLAAAIAILLQAHLARADQLEFNPLQSLHQQLNEVIKECADRPLERICEERKKAIKDEIKRLRKVCKTTLGDRKCEALYIPQREFVNQMAMYCMQNPHERKCVRMRDLNRRKRNYLAKYCKTNPEAPRCQPKSEKPKGLAGMLEYCQVYPEKKRCVAFMKRLEKSRRPTEDAPSNAF